VGYRKETEADKFWFMSLSYGSASDRPFKNNRDNTLGANFIKKFNSNWFALVNYSNNRNFLNNIPIPGFFYIKEMSREQTLVFGIPFIFWMKPISDNWSFRYLGLLPWTHRLKILYTKFAMISPYVSLEQSPQSYFRHD